MVSILVTLFSRMKITSISYLTNYWLLFLPFATSKVNWRLCAVSQRKKSSPTNCSKFWLVCVCVFILNCFLLAEYIQVPSHSTHQSDIFTTKIAKSKSQPCTPRTTRTHFTGKAHHKRKLTWLPQIPVKNRMKIDVSVTAERLHSCNVDIEATAKVLKKVHWRH